MTASDARSATPRPRKSTRGTSIPQGAVLPAGALRALQGEKEFQRAVCELLDLHKWRWHHEVDSRKSKRGFLDLVAVRGSRVLWIELKSYQGTVTDDQQDWIDALSIAGQETYVWVPGDMDEVERTLT